MGVYEIRRERLSQLLYEMYGNNKTALANRLDIQPSYLSRFSAKTQSSRRQIGDRLARRIEEVSDKDYGWLDRRNDPESTATAVADYDLVEPAHLGFIDRIPIMGDTQAGREGYWCGDTDHPATADEYIDAPSRDSGAYGLRIRGSSMWPRMREGDVLSVSPVADCLPGDYVIVRTQTGETLVKELVVCRHTEIILNSLSGDAPRIMLSADNVVLMHKVTAIVPSSMIVMP